MTPTATCNNMHDDAESLNNPTKRNKMEGKQQLNFEHNNKPMAAARDWAHALRVERVSDKAILPTRATPQAAGLDLYSVEDLEIKAGERALVETGLKIAIPEGCYGRIAPRSGLAVKHGIDVGAGVVDADYRGPLKVVIFNLSKETFRISAGDRIAQLICEKIEMPEVVDCTLHGGLDSTTRGEGGFGSTGGFSNSHIKT